MARSTTKKKICVKCLKEKHPINDFFISYGDWFGDGRIAYCKDCLKDGLDEENEKSVQRILRMIDRPYKYDSWQKAKDSDKDTLGTYLKDLAFNFKYETWEDSIFDPEYIDSKNRKNNNPQSFVVTDELIDKWGVGYSPQEYDFFERKYNILKNNYQEKTSMHREGLLNYIRFRVKEEMSTAEGDVKAAKEWGQLASKAAQDAKINPSQLSKADLSDGLDTFGQLVRTVEQHEDIIPILPQFKARPHDKPDFTMLCYINYIRDLKGLPLAKYEDIYQFYEERKKEYADQFDFLQDEDDE